MTIAIKILRRFLRDSARHLGLAFSPPRWQRVLAQPALPVQSRLPAKGRDAIGCR